MRSAISPPPPSVQQCGHTTAPAELADQLAPQRSREGLIGRFTRSQLGGRPPTGQRLGQRRLIIHLDLKSRERQPCQIDHPGSFHRRVAQYNRLSRRNCTTQAQNDGTLPPVCNDDIHRPPVSLDTEPACIGIFRQYRLAEPQRELGAVHHRLGYSRRMLRIVLYRGAKRSQTVACGAAQAAAASLARQVVRSDERVGIRQRRFQHQYHGVRRYSDETHRNALAPGKDVPPRERRGMTTRQGPVEEQNDRLVRTDDARQFRRFSQIGDRNSEVRHSQALSAAQRAVRSAVAKPHS